jgi:vancomycin resistance protein YoaR
MDIDRKRLRETMAPIAADVDHDPTPAYYLVAEGSNGQPDSAVPQPGGLGLAIDTDKTAQLILGVANSDHTVTIPLLHPHSPFDLAAARKLNFDTELAKGPTDLAASSPVRLGNAKAAAVAIDNIRLQPGQTLSVTGVISPVVKLGGYTQDLNAIAPTDVSGVNGGTVQVASALFQTAFASGLPILQRQPYPYLTTFDGPIGSDAMVVSRPRGPDLQFINDTKHQLLINVVVNSKTHRVVAYMFTDGEVVHRTVKVVGPSVTLNQDGSVDATIGRAISGDTTGQDTLTSHYDNLDPYP